MSISDQNVSSDTIPYLPTFWNKKSGPLRHCSNPPPRPELSIKPRGIIGRRNLGKSKIDAFRTEIHEPFIRTVPIDKRNFFSISRKKTWKKYWLKNWDCPYKIGTVGRYAISFGMVWKQIEKTVRGKLNISFLRFSIFPHFLNSLSNRPKTRWYNTRNDKCRQECRDEQRTYCFSQHY